MCTYPFAKKALTIHLARGESRERYFGCNLMQRKVLASLQCHNLQDWVADGAGWSYPVSAKGILAILGVRIDLFALRVVGAM